MMNQRRTAPRFLSGLENAAILLATAPLWIFLAGSLLGRVAPAIAAHGLLPPAIPDALRHFFELTSFIATTILGLTALGALLYTIIQVREARHARVAATYMEIIKRWNSDELVTSRTLILGLSRDYGSDPALSARHPGPEDYIDHEVSSIRSRDLRLHRQFVAILNFYEDVGLLCREGYVRKEHIYEFMAGQIVTQIRLMGRYIQSARIKKAEENRTTYANAIFLYKNALKYRQRGGLHEEDWAETDWGRA